MLALALALLAAAPPRVEVGLERLEAEHGGLLRGKRVGLVAHAASVTAGGRHALDVLREQGVLVVRLFAPEHGLRGAAAAGESVPGGQDPATGLPVVSLYGEQRAPRPEDLRDLDALVVDLQDAGVRFYTYASTLLLCLDAAAQAGLELVLLDRPNPLGGLRVEGPSSDPPERVPSSFLNMAPGPLVHGLTLGELARFANARRARPARLTVVPMRGWRRAFTWARTGRPWVPPSPNLRTAEAALAYPGVCLLEATNVSEGRGSEAPFLLFGAPWLEPADLRVKLRGAVLEPADFVPLASPAAPEPRYAGSRCRGLRVRVTDARAFSPFELGVRLLHALRRQPGFAWRDGGAALTRLLGSAGLLEALERGERPEEILAALRPAAGAWRRERRPALLYD